MKNQCTYILIVFLSLIIFPACLTRKPPTDKEGRPLIVKLGTIDCDLVETTPIVFNNKVYRFEYVRTRYWNNHTGDSYFRFVDHETGEFTKSFAEGYHLGSAFVYNDTVYVTAVDKWDGETVYIFASNDLENWNCRKAFTLPGYGIYNTSLIKADNKFVLMFEIGKPEEEAGVRFTAHFATSPDLKEWEVLSSDHNYSKDRYTAPHCLRYLDGYFYNFFLESYNGFEMRVVRSKDFIEWESSLLIPILEASSEDKIIVNENLPEDLKQKIYKAENCNNSDIDFCEYKGQLIINYSWGNQTGIEFLAEAFYEGTTEQFLRGWFPE